MQHTSASHLSRVFDAVRETERNGLLSDRRAEGLSGISGLKTVGVLQRLAGLFSDDPTACYVEVGVFQGLTLISTALDAPTLPCFGIDNFRILDPEGLNLSIVNERLARFAVTNARLLNMDFEAALESIGAHIGDRQIAIYFVDGPHDYRSQLICLTLARRHLHDRAIVVIDDANYPDVRMATHDFLLACPEFKLVFEAYTPAHPVHLDPIALRSAEAGWLNGVHVLTRDPEGMLDAILPPVASDRTVYFNEWLSHRLRLAELAPEALRLADAVCSGNSEAELSGRAALLDAYKDGKRFSARFSDRNVMSEALPGARFNPASGQFL